MDFKQSKAAFKTEAERLINYQHQHRGIRFIKLYLPPPTDKEVNLVGQDDHIYRGRIPRVSEDQLPLEVDEHSLNEVKLYQEIKDMDYPLVPPQEPLSQNRRIEGSYTLNKKLILAPLKVQHDTDLEEYRIIGRDGGIYRGKERYASQVQLDKQIRGTKRLLHKKRQQSKSAGIVEPAVVTLQGTHLVSGGQTSSVKIPLANVREIMAITKQQNTNTTHSKSNKRQKMTANEVTSTTRMEQINKAHGERISGESEDTGKFQDAQEDIQTDDSQDEQNNKDETEINNVNESLEMQDAENQNEIDDAKESSEAEDDANDSSEAEDIEEQEDFDDAKEVEDIEESKDFDDANEEEPEDTN